MADVCSRQESSSEWARRSEGCEGGRKNVSLREGREKRGGGRRVGALRFASPSGLGRDSSYFFCASPCNLGVPKEIKKKKMLREGASVFIPVQTLVS